MKPENGEKGLPKEVIICRFGSAFSTLTVMLLDKRIPDNIQGVMTRLEEAKDLKEPNLVVEERVCFKNSSGRWTRARIRTVHVKSANDETTVDLILDDTKEVLKRVSDEALVAIPDAVHALDHAKLYFVKGLEPYSVAITRRQGKTSVAAQACADALNKEWESIPKSTRLLGVTPPSEILSYARRAGISVATLSLNGDTHLRLYIEQHLRDFRVLLSPDLKYVRQAKHPKVPLCKSSSILVPFTSKREICEVTSLRRVNDTLLKVGLRLSRYIDLEMILQRLFSRLRVYPGYKPSKGFEPVIVAEAGVFKQRGVFLESGEILGIDTLDVFSSDDTNVDLRMMAEGPADAFPHTGLIVDWSTSANSRTPCVGDSVVVTNLQPRTDAGELFEYTYEEFSFRDASTVPGYRPLRTPRQLQPPTEKRAERAAEGERKKATEKRAEPAVKGQPKQATEKRAEPAAEGQREQATDKRSQPDAEDRSSLATENKPQLAAGRQLRADRRQHSVAGRTSEKKLKNKSRPTFAKWYDLDPALEATLRGLPTSRTFQPCKVEAVLSEFGESLPVQYL